MGAAKRVMTSNRTNCLNFIAVKSISLGNLRRFFPAFHDCFLVDLKLGDFLSNKPHVNFSYLYQEMLQAWLVGVAK